MRKTTENFYFLSIILLLAFSRLIPHPPNFTPVIAILIMGTIYFNSSLKLILAVLLSMFLSDLIIGLHKNLFVIYFAIFSISIITKYILDKNLTKNLLTISFTSSAFFFLLTNFAVWFSSEMYSFDLKGLIQCYIMAIPFFLNTLLSTIFFCFLIDLITRSLIKKKLIKFENKNFYLVNFKATLE